MRTKNGTMGTYAKPHGQSRANVKSKMKSKMESKMKSKMKSKVKSKVKQKATKTGEKNTKAQAISLTRRPREPKTRFLDGQCECPADRPIFRYTWRVSHARTILMVI